jgi:thiol-disulfide isomerase/thioredoxin
VSATPSPRRRALVAVGVAAAAGLGGLWLGARRGPGADAAAPPALWDTGFAQLDGSFLRLSTFRGQPLIVNFWASWCAPCVKEMPQFDRFHQTHAAAGWRVVGLAVDRPEAVKAFLARTPVRFPVALAGLDGTELMSALGNRQGGLPFTVVIDREGWIVQRRLGETSYDDLVNWSRG